MGCEGSIRIEKLENGFEVEVYDEKISKANEKPKAAYQSPWKKYAFSTGKEVIAFVTRHLDAMPKSTEDEFNEAAKEAFKE